MIPDNKETNCAMDKKLNAFGMVCSRISETKWPRIILFEIIVQVVAAQAVYV